MKRGKAGEGTQTRLHFPFFPGRLKYSDEEGKEEEAKSTELQKRPHSVVQQGLTSRLPLSSPITNANYSSAPSTSQQNLTVAESRKGEKTL